MKNIKRTSELVKEILQTIPATRNSDSYLYLKVIEHIAEQRGIDLNILSVHNFFNYMSVYGFPPMKSVNRARRKLQREFPELRANPDVEAVRMENESIVRDYARAVNV